MTKIKGAAKTRGRKAGIPNKTTAEIRQAIIDIVSMNIDNSK